MSWRHITRPRVLVALSLVLLVTLQFAPPSASASPQTARGNAHAAASTGRLMAGASRAAAAIERPEAAAAAAPCTGSNSDKVISTPLTPTNGMIEAQLTNCTHSLQ